jgi:murein DD-endopeptidase MepM/ murein hydrolase activator NlpD
MKVIFAAVLLSVGVLGIGVINNAGEAIAANKSLVAPQEILENSDNGAKLIEETSVQPSSTIPQNLAPNLPEEPEISDRPIVLIREVVKESGQNLKKTEVSRQILIEVANKPVQGSADLAPVVFESRSSGCSASDRNLDAVKANLCNLPPKSDPDLSYRNSGNQGNGQQEYANYRFSGIRATVKPLAQTKSWTRIALPFNLSINLPLSLSNNLGDRQITFPLSIPAMISSSFGYRIHPITGAERFHQGTDIAAAEGTPVLAAYSGKVEISGWLGGLGLAVIISHESDRESRYGHLSEVFVQSGQWVEQGTVIGLVGSTGMSTGPHLHFELWKKELGEWVATDPSPYLVGALERLNRFLAQQSKSNPA